MKQRTIDGVTYIELEMGDLVPAAYTHLYPLEQERREPSRGVVTICLSREAVRILGEPGRLLAEDKDDYLRRHSQHDVLFNACIFDRRGREIYFGDLDLTLEGNGLRQLAGAVGQIWVTPELPFRWRGLPDHPKSDPDIRIYRPVPGS